MGLELGLVVRVGSSVGRDSQSPVKGCRGDRKEERCKVGGWTVCVSGPLQSFREKIFSVSTPLSRSSLGQT